MMTAMMTGLSLKVAQCSVQVRCKGEEEGQVNVCNGSVRVDTTLAAACMRCVRFGAVRSVTSLLGCRMMQGEQRM